ncbi:hypothetical protein [Paenibacillus sp.]|uniref:hypothetical protein n=1 Tax=Paenibacillus sp. TaxID=58172 RepID=UPI002828A452|nr:hypothetical protein [Paenibacillus sp.]MDR0268686.1 hypothetical protein [Paenibacillus sp.]
MNVHKLAKHYYTGKFPSQIEQYLPTALLSQLHKMNVDEVEKLFDQTMRSPIDLSRQWSPELIEFYYTASLYNLFVELDISSHASLYEIAAGDTVCIPRALDAYSNNSTYVTANLNKELSRRFMQKTADLSIQIKIIEDNGNNLLQYYEPQSFEVISFHHAINDIIQTIIADIEGIDTVNNDWWTIEPQMLQAVMRYHNRGELRRAAFESFINIIDTCMKLLKKGGYLIFDNCTYAGYDQMGYSSEFHSAYIQLAREWIHESNLGFKEVELEGYDQQWWMMMTK